MDGGWWMADDGEYPNVAVFVSHPLLSSYSYPAERPFVTLIHRRTLEKRRPRQIRRLRTRMPKLARPIPVDSDRLKSSQRQRHPRRCYSHAALDTHLMSRRWKVKVILCLAVVAIAAGMGCLVQDCVAVDEEDIVEIGTEVGIADGIAAAAAAFGVYSVP